MKALLFAAMGAALLAASGCAGGDEAPRPPRPVPPAAQPAVEAPARSEAFAAASSPEAAPDAAQDLCRAQELQSHVGQPLASLPPTPEGVSRRTICRDCAMTEDLRQDRQTVIYDAESTLILSVSCV